VAVATIEVLRSGVNTWECDQMGHLNVRHYLARANQGLVTLLLQLGLLPSQMRAQGLALRTRDQHVRFLRELRPGTSFSVHAGVVSASAQRLFVFEEMRLVHEPAVAASMLSEVSLEEVATGDELPFSDAVLAHARALTTDIPTESAPRGVERITPRVPPMRDEALERGLVGAFLGPVLPEDCDAFGVMTEGAFMARVSDGMGHLFNSLRSTRHSGVGGAALEYRYVFHERPRLGDVIEVRSGLKGVGRKTTHLCHWIFNVETGRCAATSEAVAVSFDLTTRKSLDISPEARTALLERVVPGLSV
jgi:acyl-CoA thioester hydrolase